MSRRAGFIDGVSQFDTEFFGISPREAARMDPQQRLLLEVAWEALEDGGIVPAALAGRPVGVFIGLSGHDFSDIQLGAGERAEIDAHTASGSAMSIAANRISYLLDLRGPSLVVDTACSSALVALDLGCRSLHAGESEIVICGAANLLARPEMTIAFSKASMLAPDGRCKAFDARANGYVRAEGAGAVVLKPLSRALADGDPIYAVILATATNQDGRTVGLTVPGVVSQQALLDEVCRRGGVEPREVGFVEAHGTGTPVGDPIEALALGRALGSGRSRSEALLIGSVKTNIGHLESAAGIAGLIKATLAVAHREVPRNLHFETPNPAIDFAGLGLRVPVETTAWPSHSARTVAGVNSFGFGGTNAHVLLAAAPGGPPVDRAEARGAATPTPRLFPISARSPGALAAVASELRDWLGEVEPAARDLERVASVLAHRRSHHPYRRAIVASDVEGLRAALADGGGGRGGLSAPGPTVFVYTGMGPQWPGMGRELLTEDPVFRTWFTRVSELIAPLAGFSLTDQKTTARMEETAVAQPANFALQVALTAWLRDAGVVPDFVVGHSAGEVAAAWASGILELPEAARIIVHRSRVQQRAAGQGTLVAVGVGEGEARLALTGRPELALAGINGPASVTLVGPRAALEALVRPWEDRDVFVRFIRTDVPFHGPSMDPLRAPLLSALGTVRAGPATVPMVSTVTGAPLDGRAMDASYWWRNVREPVQFLGALRSLLAAGASRFLEIGPHPALGPSILETARRASVAEPAVVATLRRGAPERATLLSAVGQLYVQGSPILFAAPSRTLGAPLRLPTYPWQRSTHWHESPGSRRQRVAPLDHPLLGARLEEPRPAWEGLLDLARLPWLADHALRGEVVFPAAGFFEIAAAATALLETAAGPPLGVVLEHIRVERALFLGAERRASVRTTLDPEARAFEIHGRSGEEGWVRHVSGKCHETPHVSVPELDLGEIRGRLSERLDSPYPEFKRMGLEYGPAFRGLGRIWRGPREALAEVRVPPEGELSAAGVLGGCRLPPPLLDACFQLLLAATDGAKGALFVPVDVERLHLIRPLPTDPATTILCWARLREQRAERIVGDLVLCDGQGIRLAEVRGIGCQPLDRGPATVDTDTLHYTFGWAPGPPAHHDPTWIPACASLSEALRVDCEGLTEELGNERASATRALDELAAAFAVAALVDLGAEWTRGAVLPLAEIRARTHLRHRKYLDHLCLRLGQAGLLVSDPTVSGAGGWRVGAPTAPAGALLDTLAARYTWPELGFVGRCGSRLAGVLTGDVDPLSLLFPGGSVEEATALYRDGPASRIYGRLGRLAVERALATCPVGVRVLEVGAGTGGLTSHVLPPLAAAGASYLFTDISPAFLAAATTSFGGVPGFSTAVFDIERPLAAQGLRPGSFDIVLASNVLHATADVSASLAAVRELLAPRGLLLLAELTTPPLWVDLVFGLTEGWWRFTDRHIRPRHAVLDAPGWLSALFAAGFEAEVVTDEADPAAPAQGLFVARAPARSPRTWLVFADDVVAPPLCSRLQARGDRVLKVRPGDEFSAEDADFQVRPGERPDLHRLLSTRPDEVLHLWSLRDLTSTLDGAARLGSLSVLPLAQELAGLELPPRLTVVTRGAQSVADDDPLSAPEQAPIAGLVRVMANELPALRCSAIDLGSAPTAGEADRLLDALSAGEGEPEVAIRGSERHVLRVRRGGAGVSRVDPEAAWRLETPRPGRLDELVPREASRRNPAPDEVEIRVYAAGLNFKDVLKGLGVLSPATLMGGLSGFELGMECAGVVVRVGSAVDHLREGDEVVAIGPGAFASYLTTPASLVAPKPRALGFAESSALPLAYLTVLYALEHLGRMQAGETVLIHAAAGGVGLAAISAARAAGLTIYATAGSDEKRELARAAGARRVFDSRSSGFAEAVRAETHGRGVDLVLNSLAGAGIRESVGALAPYGRFLELGKRDIEQNHALDLLPFGENLSFFAIDIDRLLKDRVELAGRLFREAIARVDAGTLGPLPVCTFPMTEAEGAFRRMAQARHTGKLVLDTRTAGPQLLPARRAQIRFDFEATWLITGGLGGFGFAVARWMVEHGARHIMLVGRRMHPGAGERIRALTDGGADVRFETMDVADEADVGRVLAVIAATMPPLGGVFHAAMVLDDALVTQLDPERFERVHAPKARGAENLHRLTRDLPLRHFVLFSSIACVWGAPGQANYVSANCYLDALALHRRGLGLPALSVSWGAIGEVGYVAERSELARYLERQGMLSVPSADALDALGRAMMQAEPRVVVANVDWPTWRRAFPASAGLARYSAVATAATPGGIADDASRGSPREELAELVGIALIHRLEERLRVHAATVLEVRLDRLDSSALLSGYGLDSLMGVELKGRIEGDIGVEVPLPTLLRGPSIHELATILAGRLQTSNPPEGVVPLPPPGEPSPATPQLPQRAREDEPLGPRGWSYRAAGAVVVGAMGLLRRASRFEVEGPPLPASAILCAWHEHMVAMSAWVGGEQRPFVGLFHPSLRMMPWEAAGRARDWRVVRGSSGYDGEQAAEGLIAALQDGYTAVVHPDGPSGPARALKWGVVHMARRAGVLVVPVRFTYDAGVQLIGWDRKWIPLPFSAVSMRLGEPVEPEGLEPQEMWRRIRDGLG